jgi:asparagine synthase (glutamine-hydrolysing)
MADDLARMVWQLDEPQADFAPLNAMYIAKLARDRGIKVLLSGAGGDDVFTGYRRHLALQAERTWAWLPARARRAVGAASLWLPARPPLARRVRKALAAWPLEDSERIVRYFQWIVPESALTLMAPEHRGSSALEFGTKGRLARTLHDAPRGSTRLDRMLYVEAKHFLADHNLPYTNKMGMAVGVEVRVPLLDREVVASAARLPDRYKQHAFTGKWVFKKAMEGILPRDVIYRPKTGFGVPLRRWLRGPLAGLADDLLSDSTIKLRGLFDAASVRDLLIADRAGREDGSHIILALMCVELWCRRFVDGTSAV